MDTLQEEAIAEVTKSTTEVLKHLTAIWTRSYSPETVKDYIQKLPRHVDDLLDHIVNEAEVGFNMYTAQMEGLADSVVDLSNSLSEPIDMESYMQLPKRDATLALSELLEKFQKMHAERQNEIKELIKEETEVCKILNLECKSLSKTILPTKQDIDDFKVHLDELNTEKNRRETELIRLKEELVKTFNDFAITPTTGLELSIQNDSTLELNQFEDVQKLHSEYLVKLEVSKHTIAGLKDKLEALWELMEETTECRAEFLNHIPSCDLETIYYFNEEIKRREELKKKNVKVYIEMIRDKITFYWDLCMLSQNERSTFSASACKEYTCDLLALHETELHKWQTYYDDHRKIFETFNKRSDLYNKLEELEILSKSPGRYNNRGGRLLLEERERKKVVQQLPKIDEKLLHLVRQYKLATGNIFTIYGDPVEDIIENGKKGHPVRK